MSTDKAYHKNIIMFSDKASLNIIFSISVLMLEVCTAIFPLSYVVFLRLYALFWYFVAASFTASEGAVPTESMSKSEKSEAAEEIVQASDESMEPLILTEYDEFHGLYEDHQYLSNRFLFKITDGKIVKRFVAHIVDGTFVFDMSQLKGKIKYLFNLPIESELQLSYIDEHFELITMTDDDDLEDIMTQMALPMVRMHVSTLINNAPTRQVGEEGAGLRHTGTNTNTSENDSPAKSDNDDWLIY